MKGMSTRRRVITTCVFTASLTVASLAGAPVAKAGGGAPTFGTPITLPSSRGGEPSIAVDTPSCSGTNCNIYVVSPNATSSGPAIWRSSNDGATWGAATQIDNIAPCSAAPGGDTDVDVLPNGNVTAADLNVTWATVQVSTDHAATFPACTETAFEDDRPWLAHQGSSTIYVAYHDFVLEVPIVCTSTTASGTSAGTFTCVQAFGTTANPGGAGTQLTNCAENTVPARSLVVDPVDASLNFMYSCSTAAENAAAPPYGPLHDYYLARSTNGVTYTTSTIIQADTSGGKKPNLANIFGSLVTDTAGNYYALWAGTLDDSRTLTNAFHVYLSTSKDKGSTWSKPIVVDHEADGLGTHTLAHLAATTPGNVDIIWYGTTNTGEPNGQCGSTGMVTACKDGTTPDGMDFGSPNSGGPVPGNWKVYMAQTTNALSASPTFTYSTIDPNYRHFGTICTNGIVCGGASDRHLLDFISVAVDCSGAAHVTYGADQNTATAPAVGAAGRVDGPLTTVVTNQNGGTSLAPPLGCANPVSTPEAPLVPLLPLGAVLAAGLVAIGRRRRAGTAVG